MVKESEELDTIFTLKGNPSIIGWEVEIRNIIYGKLDHDIIRIGSIEEYIEMILTDSKDFPKAKTFFQNALNNVVREWIPSLSDEEIINRCFLELIGTYKPPYGSIKIIGFLEKLYIELPPQIINKESERILSFFSELKGYYPASPLLKIEDPNFKKYIQILRKYFTNTDLRNHALVRLMELNMIEYEEEIVINSIMENPSSIYDIIPSILMISNIDVLEIIENLYFKILSTVPSLETNFIDAIQQEGISFIDLESELRLKLRNQERTIRIPNDDSLSCYMEFRWKRSFKIANKKTPYFIASA